MEESALLQELAQPGEVVPVVENSSNNVRLQYEVVVPKNDDLDNKKMSNSFNSNSIFSQDQEIAQMTQKLDNCNLHSQNDSDEKIKELTKLSQPA